MAYMPRDAARKVLQKRSIHKHMVVHSLAVDKPSPWVDCREAHDQPSSGGEKGGIAAGWVVKLKIGFATIPDAGALADDIVIWNEMSATSMSRQVERE
jgi:hypothetical protein